MSHYDVGFTHVALQVNNLKKSIDFYRRYAELQVIHQREPGVAEAEKVVWMSDFIRPFVLVLVESQVSVDAPLGPFGHLGVACRSKEEVDQKAALAEQEGILRKAPEQYPAPVGYWAFVADPDGNTLELSFGQQVGIEASGSLSLQDEKAASI